MLFFFFKHKTAYEMRISDWSSYVCSSDLIRRSCPLPLHQPSAGPPPHLPMGRNRSHPQPSTAAKAAPSAWPQAPRRSAALPSTRSARSEEHTSELPSLMRNSYAVFCLKKKKKKHNTQIDILITTHK